MMEYFKIDDEKTSKDYGTYILSQTYESAEKDMEEIEVDGRNGSLLIDNGTFKNNKIIYECITKKILVFPARKHFDELVNCLQSKKGYFKLADTIRKDEYRLAYLKSVSDVEVYGNEFIKFKLEFVTKPQRYLNKGDVAKNIGIGVRRENNPTPFTSKPWIHVNAVSGRGGTLKINDKPIFFYGNIEDVYIDSETMTVIDRNGRNVYNQIKLHNNEFPILTTGDNTIEHDGAIDVEIKTRWWTV